MRSGGGGGAGSRGNGSAASVTAAPIPSGSRKLVQSLKEIVNCPEPEIYAMLRECDMDPNEAIHRLLSQDTFHEVKSKRDKKKEIREPPESRSRTLNNSSIRGARSSTDRGGRTTSSQSSSVDHGTGKGRLMHKKENGTSPVLTSSVPESSTVSSNPPRRPTVPSDSASVGITIQATSAADGICISMQSSSGYKNCWSGMPGHVSMADIVRMGRPQGKPSNMPLVGSERSVAQNSVMSKMLHHDAKPSLTAVLPSESDKTLESFQESTHFSENSHDVRTAEGQHNSHDGWSCVDEQPLESGSTTPEISGASAQSELASSNLVIDGSNLHIDPHSEEIQMPEEGLNFKSLPAESRATSVSGMQIQIDSSVDAPHLNEGLLKSSIPYLSQRLELDHLEGSFPAGDVRVQISSAAVNLGQLSLHEERNTNTIEANPSVIIPDHLRVTNADCAHLSFGSFVSGTFSGSFPTKPLKSNLEVAPVVADASMIEDSDARNHEYYSDGQLTPPPVAEDSDVRNHEYFSDGQHTTTLTENVASISGTVSENPDAPSASQSEVVRNDPLDATHEIQYNLPAGANYAFPSSTEPNATTYTYLQGNAQMQSLSPFSTLMQSHNLQNSMLAPNIPPLRDFDLPLSPLLTTQSIPTRYSTTLSSISGSTISMSEALNPGVFSNSQSIPQSLPSTTMLTSASLPQHLPVRYSQPALPLSHFANMMSYSFLPQSYPYLPSFQQAYAANSPFHQSHHVAPSAGMSYSQPQFKSSLSATSLPQVSSIASAYGGFGSAASIPGGFTLNHTTASANTTTGLGEALSLQYKEGSHYMPLQQNENPAMWVQGAGSRTVSALPASTFYNYQGHNQQSGFRQNLQASPLGALGYPNLYLSQGGPSREHQQSPSDGNLNGSQATQSQPANQIWQHGY
ncbi:unnamed protein product [Musa hybrid cultivar]